MKPAHAVIEAGELLLSHLNAPIVKAFWRAKFGQAEHRRTDYPRALVLTGLFQLFLFLFIGDWTCLNTLAGQVLARTTGGSHLEIQLSLYYLMDGSGDSCQKMKVKADLNFKELKYESDKKTSEVRLHDLVLLLLDLGVGVIRWKDEIYLPP